MRSNKNDYETFKEEVNAFLIREHKDLYDAFQQHKDELDDELHKVKDELEKMIRASSIDLKAVYDETITNLTRKSSAIARVIDTSEKRIKDLAERNVGDYAMTKAITQRLAEIDQKINALQVSIPNGENRKTD